jgi:hypothetical protein
VRELDALLRDRLAWPDSVALESQPDKKRRRRRRGQRESVARDALYEARIHEDRRIPTREASMHDLANALVWAAFPRSKRALVARQYAALVAQVPDVVVDRLPGARTKERDALAMLDEGGLVLLVARDDDDARLRAPTRIRDACARADHAELARLREARAFTPFVFGHALLEHVARHPSDVRAFGVVLAPDPAPSARAAPTVEAADAALAAWITARREHEACGVSLRAAVG